jgi:hypothetical protein
MTKPVVEISSSPEGASKGEDVVESASTTISPIRAFATRQQLQQNSNASLTQDDGPTETNAGPVPDPAVSILDAISKLESIMEEAVKLAQLAGETDSAAPEQPVHGDNVRLRRPSSAIRSKGLQYLDHAGDHVMNPLHRTLHGDRYPAKAGLAPPQLTASTALSNQTEDPTIDDQVERTKSGLEVLPPRPSSTPPGGTSTSKHKTLPSKAEIKAFIRSHAKPPISARLSSRGHDPEGNLDKHLIPPTLKLNDEEMPEADGGNKHLTAIALPKPHYQSSFSRMFGVQSRHSSLDFSDSPPSRNHAISLSRLNHVDIRNKPDNFDVYDTCTHASVARDWPAGRKRFMAAVVCINTVCVGILIGIYAGEVPAIQYRLADFHHFAILGNVVLYTSMAISTLLFWPLPLLHGRKIYTVLGFVTAFGLQIPQGLALESYRYPHDIVWRTSLMLSRCVSGFVLGFVNINLHATLLDLFGSSLQSQHPHGEVPDPYDARRHGGGIGMWLAAWSWCSIGSISFGFMIGAFIIENASVDWGFWTSLILLMFVVTLNVIAPEVRRSAFRRTLADFIGVEGAFSRVARGEIKMHLMGTGPYWWGEEVQAGLKLSWSLVKQPGFFIVALYAAWAYAQFTLILMVCLSNVYCSC